MDILLFLVEGFPLTLTVAGILCHVLYASLLRTFPEIKILSIGFLGGSGIALPFVVITIN